ncbi:acetyltransferase [Gymnodinialimonas sp. 57CJ19]|uniref:acetyltransferase n=1 Tax=Gymnodinialimonas sp. 57CJ19 TaxID=3138498 RepID=UPI003134523A
MKDLIIIGAGEFADIAYEYFSVDSDYTVVGFAVEEAHITDATHRDLPVVALETVETTFPTESVHAFVAITNTQHNRLRERLMQVARSKGYKLTSFISPHAFVWRTARVGENVFIFENNVVQHGVDIADGCILWSGNHVGHQSRIGACCFLSSQVVISGYCNIGERCFLGVNSTIADHVCVPKDSLIGLGSVISKSIDQPGAMITGNPAEVSRVSTYRFFRLKD